MGKTLGEMTPEERRAAIARAAARIQAELRANADRIGEILAAADRPAAGPLRAHRARWYVYAGAERIPHEAGMRGAWGYDVTCSCGWDSKTGGGTRRYVAAKLDEHRTEAQWATTGKR
jgi:hypothetical protein